MIRRDDLIHIFVIALILIICACNPPQVIERTAQEEPMNKRALFSNGNSVGKWMLRYDDNREMIFLDVSEYREKLFGNAFVESTKRNLGVSADINGEIKAPNISFYLTFFSKTIGPFTGIIQGSEAFGSVVLDEGQKPIKWQATLIKPLDSVNR